MIILKLFFITILFLLVFAVLSVLTMVGRIRNLIHQLRNGDTQNQSNNKSYSSERQQRNDSFNGSQTNGKKKIIPQDEGEYVDFEEIDS